MSDSAVRSRSALIAEAVATGAWLGLVQVGLGFALLAGSGASGLLFFALTGAWLGGGAIGVVGGRARRAAGASGAGLLGLALLALGVARVALASAPFSDALTGVGLLAGAIAGAYAGHFLRERAAEWGDVRALLLHENNGFVAGYAAAGALLFVSTRALHAAAGLLGAVLLGRSLLKLR